MREISSAMIFETARIEQDALLVLYDVDMTAFGGDVYRFYAGMTELRQPIVWRGQTYVAFPVSASGFEGNAKGTSNRPKLTLANVGGLLTGLNAEFDDLVGAVVTRRQVYARFLDAENFPQGNANADPTQEVVLRFEIERMIEQSRETVSYELALPCETDGAIIPCRPILADICPIEYRSADCGYTGGPVADIKDNPTSDPACDRCGKRLSSCKLRFGAHNPLPFGGFPSAAKFR
ncbi:MAG: phage minor tail protein L [Plesiomonas shigelloides]